MSELNSIEIDVAARVMRAGAGCRLGDVVAAAEQHGLATSVGSDGTTGLAGFALAGGFGSLAKRLGAMVDNLISVDVVTVDGEELHVSAEENEELFWGLRGAGANLAVATAFEIRLHALAPSMLAGMIVHPFAVAREAFEFWRSFTQTAPDVLAVGANLMILPPQMVGPDFPDGLKVFCFDVAWHGDIDEGEAAIRPLREWGQPLNDMVQATTLNTNLIARTGAIRPGEGRGLRVNEDGTYLPDLTDDVIATAIAAFESAPTPTATSLVSPLVGFTRLGGAFAAVDNDATAFTREDAEYWWAVLAMWDRPEDDQRIIDWSNRSSDALRALSSRRSYIHLTVRDDAPLLRDSYGEHKWERLLALKQRWDPENVLRFNKNIRPA